MLKPTYLIIKKSKFQMSEKKRQRVCIIKLSPTARASHVLRQVEYLSAHYDITLIGYGDAPPQWIGKIEWHNVMGNKIQQWTDRILRIIIILLGRFLPFILPLEYVLTRRARYIKKILLETNAGAYHANDWDTLPLVVPIATQLGAKIVFDAHEYSPEQHPSGLRQFFLSSRPLYFLKRYAYSADYMITVSPMLQEKYAERFGLNSHVVMNAPHNTGLTPTSVNSDAIQLVHHGSAKPRRHLELMIKTLQYTDERYHLNFYLIGQTDYIETLKRLAQRIAPNRVHFHDAIAPEYITRKINQHDMGFYILKPYPFNHKAALPNKFFDFINASLAVCISPTPGMASLARQYDFSLISETYEPQEIAQKLNALTPERIMEMKQNAYEASKTLNSDVEMGKLVRIYADLLSK